MRSHRGMTLLELSVALAVGGAALSIGGAAVATLLDRRESVLADAEVNGRALAARRMIVAWVADVRAGAPAEGILDGRRGIRRSPSGDMADDSISFLTAADGALQHVRLFVDRSADRSALVADIGAVDVAPRRVVLAADVAGLEVSYLTSAFGRREWRRTWNGALWPAAVELRLVASSGTALPAPLRLPITVPLGGGQ